MTEAARRRRVEAAVLARLMTRDGVLTSGRAERFARPALIDSDVIARHPEATDAELARLLSVPPLQQLQLFLADDAQDVR